MLTAENKTQLSARLKPDENARVTAFFEHYQQQNGVEFSTFKEFIMHLTENDSFLISESDKAESIKVADIKPELSTYSEVHDLPLESTASTIVKHALTQLPTVEQEPQIKEVEKIVEKELPENGLLLLLDEEQINALQEINENRNNLLEEPEPIEETSKGLMFNESTLHNIGGGFYTGFS